MEILETFEQAFCFRKSHINENGGKVDHFYFFFPQLMLEVCFLTICLVNICSSNLNYSLSGRPTMVKETE